MNMQKAAPNAPVYTNEITVGTIKIVVLVHSDRDGSFWFGARDVRHNYPRSENLDTALDLLSIDPEGTKAGHVGGLYAYCSVDASAMAEGVSVIGNVLAEAAREKQEAIDALSAPAMVEPQADESDED